jgi:signal transduction histidine kinase
VVTATATTARAREQERRRLSRELHDGVGSALAGMLMVVGAARSGAGDSAGEVLGEIERGLAELAGEVRHLIAELRPPALAELGLDEALRRHAARLARGTGLQLTVSCEGTAELPEAVELAAYRIAAEAMTNAARHARARSCDVALVRGDRELWIRAVDDGIGIAPGRPAGVGMTATSERAAELGGRCEWSAGAGGGTVFECRLPLS